MTLTASTNANAMERIAVPDELAHMRRFPLDGALLLFDRDTGLNARCEGPETQHLRQVAPRAIQFGLTNRCNLTCHFCSRDQTAESLWSQETAFRFLAELGAYGVLEVAFGGGEPWAFPGFDELVCDLYRHTRLAVSFTTNGVALTPARLARIEGCYGQIRLSIYDDNDWRRRVEMLATAGARFGANVLVTPVGLRRLTATVLELVALGCSDVLLLSYNGFDAGLHLAPPELRALRTAVGRLRRALGRSCTLKLDVCWGDRMAGLPRLFHRDDCGAGEEFMVVTSDRKVMACSFHHQAIPVGSAGDLMALWRDRAAPLRQASTVPGCARADVCGPVRRLAVVE